jgi:hypothetical protein
MEVDIGPHIMQKSPISDLTPPTVPVTFIWLNWLSAVE